MGVLAGVLAGVLIRVLTDLLVRGRDAGFASDTFVVPAVTEHTTQTELDAMSHALKRLDSAQRNMIDTDLRGIDLRDMDDRERLLDGVRWSTGTRWPPELQGWVDQHSEQIGLDLYEIHTHDKARSRAKSS
ncbi:hypothetical protein [Actinocrispum wychmicini]|uniref:hypothetical protein n=1 Tax=Actinocrispum wychmicini TaxID=1213861 RepID=UPI00104BF8D2|nr:hypothetical protein [Actinocrispum wychmicini]